MSEQVPCPLLHRRLLQPRITVQPEIYQPSIFLKSSCPFPPTFSVSCAVALACGFWAPIPGLRARPRPALGLDAAVRGTNTPAELVEATAG